MVEDISEVYKHIGHASMRSGREADEVELIAVSKTKSARAIREAYDAGLRVFGESKVQEAMNKASELSDLMNISWHLVGHLQSNKAKQAVALFDLIHSVDSIKLMETIDRHAGQARKVQSILLQLKLSDEESKSGANETLLLDMLNRAKELKNIKVEGLMTVTPFFDNPEDARPYYARLRELAHTHELKELSMGMTGDYKEAILEGATMVRVGTAIFGQRSYT